MTDMGLNEDEKNEKTQALVESVNAILGTKKQGSAKQQQSPRTVASRV
jgi:hypothetical protein